MENEIAVRLFNKIKLHTFPGRLGPYASQETIDIYNQIYQFWNDTWNTVMEGIGSHLPPTEEFFRQDKILGLMNGSEVVAFLCLNQYNIKTAARHHTYLAQYNNEFWDVLGEKNISSVWSGQFISVNPKYSARITKLSFAGVILGLLHEAYRDFQSYNTALISLARTDVPSASTAYKYGWEPVGKPISMHNVPVEQIALFGAPPLHKDETVNAMVSKYWKERDEHESGYTNSERFVA